MNFQIRLENDPCMEQKTENAEEHWTPAGQMQKANSI